MSPEAKELFDYLLAFAGPGAAGGIILAMFGWLKARAEKPHIAPPSVGGEGLAQIGGMVMGERTARELIDGLHAVAASYDRCTLVREAEMAMRKRHREEIHEERRQTVDAIRSLADRIRDVRLN
ncbi:hypothetical protein Mnod_2946 [Methylobacterium nodulans ORS 2060]|uniref:Uncharacterized protein n=1 Tax=Methylobacterium nodulans (strain LMG 21967 / CNCM I-2342 / ORS 2060) TaxID=460265 RepID=B8IH22_METNO|nr:hypothetical protein Mnod_2946 [Methylobacterium nodulans ORS 2060]